MIILDTHALLWLDQDSESLGPGARSVIERAWRTSSVAVVAISFWECAVLEQRGRISLPKAPEVWRLELLSSGIREVPLSGALAILAASLNDFHKDPADRFIAAGALAEQATLLTADQAILEWSGPLMRQDARQ